MCAVRKMLGKGTEGSEVREISRLCLVLLEDALEAHLREADTKRGVE